MVHCTRPPQVFALFCKYDTAQRGCLTLANVYKMLGEKKSIFGDSLFELIGENGIDASSAAAQRVVVSFVSMLLKKSLYVLHLLVDGRNLNLYAVLPNYYAKPSSNP